jgi:hypothetical protein
VERVFFKKGVKHERIIYQTSRRYAAKPGAFKRWLYRRQKPGRIARFLSDKAVLRRGGYEEVQLEEIPAAQRAPLLKAYLQIADGAQPHIPMHKDAPLADFEKIAAEFPVFRLASNKY